MAAPDPAPPRGAFITLEGGEGAGKSTLGRALAARLRARGIGTLLTREPGGSPRAEAIRERLLAGDAAAAGPFAEAALFYAARLDHLEELILPALARGEWVVSDRFSDSTRAYQGALGQVDAAAIDRLERLVVGSHGPDLTLVIDVPAEIGLARAAARRGSADKDRFEREGRDFHTRLRRAFLDIAAAAPERCVVIDGTRPPEAVVEAAWAAVEARLASFLPVRADG